jgi:hypothetical protein
MIDPLPLVFIPAQTYSQLACNVQGILYKLALIRMRADSAGLLPRKDTVTTESAGTAICGKRAIAIR